jgi:hypothetical protein
MTKTQEADMSQTEAVPIPSEDLEPFAAMLIGRMWARCETAKGLGGYAYEDALDSLWWALTGLDRIATSVESAVHFTLAVQNHMMQVARLIEKETGRNPLPDTSQGRTSTSASPPGGCFR